MWIHDNLSTVAVFAKWAVFAADMDAEENSDIDAVCKEIDYFWRNTLFLRALH